jgi:hypothetical protein
MTRTQQLIAWQQRWPFPVRHTPEAQRELSAIVSAPPPVDEKRVRRAERDIKAQRAEIERIWAQIGRVTPPNG